MKIEPISLMIIDVEFKQNISKMYIQFRKSILFSIEAREYFKIQK